MILPVGKSFVVLSNATHTVGAGGQSDLPLMAKIIIFAILFPTFISISIMFFSSIKEIVDYWGNNDATDYILSFWLCSFWIAVLTLCIWVWFW